MTGTDPLASMIGLVSSADLARLWGYAGPNDAFRTFCTRLGIRPVPGRPGWYDPRHVRHRLDLVQGIGTAAPALAAPELTLVAQRRARNGTV